MCHISYFRKEAGRSLTMNLFKRASIVVCAMVVAAGFFCVVRAYGMDDSNWPTRITFVEPVQVGDLSLTPGTYNFYIASGAAARNVIMIYNNDMRRWEGMVMGVNDNRLDTSRGSGFTFVEARDGSAKMLDHWFYPGWNRGIKIVYPENQAGSMVAAITPSRK